MIVSSNVDVTKDPRTYYGLLLTGYMRRLERARDDSKRRLKTDDEIDIIVMEKVHQIDVTA